MQTKPFSQACENNKQPILEVLKILFTSSRHVLEIGSGTGQHAVFFSGELPHLTWQPTDRSEYLPGIELWRQEAQQPNLLAPLILDVTQPDWPGGFDAAFSANTAHIMSLENARHMLAQIGKRLPMHGIFALYGPFNYQGNYTSESNAQFDVWLKTVNPQQGIRDFETINHSAELAGLYLLNDYPMPANNRLLCWRKSQ